MTWTIQARTSGSDNTYRREPNADALAYFFDVCARGAPGRYTMRSEQNAVLARATVRRQDMDVKWYRKHILYALEAMPEEAEKAARYLDKAANDEVIK